MTSKKRKRGRPKGVAPSKRPRKVASETSKESKQEETKSLTFEEGMALFAPVDNFLRMGEEAQATEQARNRHGTCHLPILSIHFFFPDCVAFINTDVNVIKYSSETFAQVYAIRLQLFYPCLKTKKKITC